MPNRRKTDPPPETPEQKAAREKAEADAAAERERREKEQMEIDRKRVREEVRNSRVIT